jgi:hypothetical protein
MESLQIKWACKEWLASSFSSDGKALYHHQSVFSDGLMAVLKVFIHSLGLEFAVGLVEGGTHSSS